MFRTENDLYPAIISDIVEIQDKANYQPRYNIRNRKLALPNIHRHQSKLFKFGKDRLQIAKPIYN